MTIQMDPYGTVPRCLRGKDKNNFIFHTDISKSNYARLYRKQFVQL